MTKQIPLILLWLVATMCAAAAPFAKYRYDGKVALQDRAITPGAIRTTDAKEICAKSFRTGPYRNTTAAEKKKVYVEYGVQPNKGFCKGGCEVDHLIPLELGGLDDITDLWPQPSQPAPGFHEKDLVENWLHRQVCAGKISLSDAQKEIANDWYGIYKQMEASK